MFIAILDISTTTSDRATALAQLDAEQPAVRAMPGCIDFRVFASRERDTDVTVLHEWDDESAFAGYLDSEVFRRSGLVLRPLLTGAPLSRRFRAELTEVVA